MATTDDDPGRCWEENAATWTRQARSGLDVYRDALNTPAFLAMLPPVAGLTGLDIGCGEGHNTRLVARQGARLTGIDIAPTFIRHARETEQQEALGITYLEGSALDLPFPDSSFDFAVAFMSMMDVADPDRALGEAYRVLRPGGFFQFSILHPCFSPPFRKVLRDGDGNATAVAVARYFETGLHVCEWRFSTLDPEERERTRPFRVPYRHFTLSGWLNMIHRHGFVLVRTEEPSASEETARVVPAVADTRVAGIFIHFRVEKPGGR